MAEKQFKLAIQKIAGKSDDKAAVGVFNKRINLSDGTEGTFLSCFVVADSGVADSQVLLSDVFDLATKKIEESTAPLEAVKAAAGACEDFGTRDEVKLSFAILLFWSEACYIGRGGDDVKVLVFPKKTEIKFNFGSGPVKDGQIYLVATGKFLSIFDTAELKKPDIDLEAVVDGVGGKITSAADQNMMGAVFVKVKGEVKEAPNVAGVSKVPELAQVHEVKELPEEVVSDIEQIEGVSETEENKGVEVEEVKSAQDIVPEVSEEGIREVPKKGTQLLSKAASMLSAASTKIISETKSPLRLRRNIVIVGLVIFLILALSVGLNLRKRSQAEKISQFETHLSTASSKYSEGHAILELNKGRARELFVEADREVKLALAIDDGSEEAQNLQKDIASAIAGSETVANISFSTFYEAQSSINSLSSKDKNIVAVGEDRIFDINSSGKDALQIPTSDGAEVGAYYQDNVFEVIGDKLIKVDLKTEKSEEIGEVARASDLAVFLGNIYILADDQITKRVPIEGGYAPQTNYLSQSVSFSADSRFAIDGSVWVTNGKQVLKFLRGEKQEFAISGLAGEVGQLGAVYTSTALDNLYVVDKVNSALLVVNKDGIYQKSFQSGDFGKATDILVNSDESKIYVAVGQKILEAPLK